MGRANRSGFDSNVTWRELALYAASLALIIAGSVLSPQAFAQTATSIKDTKHNLGTTGSSTNNYQFSGTDEVCVFCHTPHGADTTAVVPIWNRVLPDPKQFTTYDMLGTASLDGKVAPVGSVSLACLSCHDGVTAFNAVINAPGSGLAGNAAWQAGTFKGGFDKMQPNTITNIGTDLRNDHPIGIQYGGGGWSANFKTGTRPAGVGDVDFNEPLYATIGGKDAWWVDNTNGGVTGKRDKTDMILYTRTETGQGFAGVAEPFVECASCHDPHNYANQTFLRKPNTGSQVCLTCHIK